MAGAVLCAWVVFVLTCRIEVWHSDAELETVGRIARCGLPFPWVSTAPGMSVLQSWGSAHLWLLPINLAVWTLAASWLWRLRTRRDRIACLLVSEAPLLLLVLLLYATRLSD